MIKEITKYIENNITEFTIDTNLFAGFRPSDAPELCSVVQETGAGKPEFDIPDAVEKTIQIITRGNSYFTARVQAMKIYAFLHGKSGITLPVVDTGVIYLANTIQAIQIPQYIGQDEKGLFEFSANYIFMIQDGS